MEVGSDGTTSKVSAEAVPAPSAEASASDNTAVASVRLMPRPDGRREGRGLLLCRGLLLGRRYLTYLGRLPLRSVVDRDHEVVGVRRGVGRDVALDESREDVLDRACWKVCISKKPPSATASEISSVRSSWIRSEMRAFVTMTSTAAIRPPPTRGSSRWLTTPENAREHRANLLLLAGREELDHPADRLGGVDRVHRREDEVAGLGRLKRGLRGLRVAELADQDHVRILTEHPAESLGEVVGVEPDLALVDDAVAIGVQDLDRILDRHDVLVARTVDVVDHRREGRRLAEPVAP